MSKRNVEAVYPLSPMQQGMLFHSLYAPESGVYFEQLTCTLRGDLDVSAFQRAWQRVVERHPVLRTSFAWKSLDKTLQIVHRQVELPFERQDWRRFSPDEQEARLEAFLQAERRRGFNLSQPPLIRLALVQTAGDACRFVWSHHHALLDGWSIPLLLKEVLAFYEALRQGQDIQLPPSRPYRDYIAWLQQQDMAEAETFWRRALQGFIAPTRLMVDRVIEGQQDQDRDEQETRLSTATTAALQSLARQHQLTLSTLVQGAWALLLSRYSGEKDVVFGATVSGRPAELAGVESMMGLFINTLPVRAQTPPEASLLAWLKALQARLVEMRQYEYSPLVQIQKQSDVPQSLPLFESILVFENYPMAVSLREQKTSLEIENVRSIEQTNYPLTVVSAPGDAFPLKISYDPRRFGADTIARMLGHLQTLLQGIAADPEQRIATLPLLAEAERQQLLVEWNDTAAEYPQHRCIHELLETQVERTPDAVAAVFEDQSLTYNELNRRANRLAHRLQKLEVGPETVVGIMVERSLEMVAGLLGVLKAGGAYLPLDPTYPPERLAFMLADSQASVLLTQAHLVERLPAHAGQTVRLDADWAEIAQESDENPLSQATADDLAYVIYTSGSTGRPKGVLLRHRGLCNLVNAQTRAFGVGADSRVMQFASFSFDASVSEVFMALLTGATLYLARQEVLASVPDLLQFLRDRAITTVTLPPSVLRVLPAEELPALATVIAAGEACTPDLVARWAAGRDFFNAYGPTETTVCASMYRCEENDAASPPIGRPIANTELYVLDRNMQPVPVGVPGELHVGGVSLARGYLHRPEMTEDKFVPHPFSEDSSARLYKTGDLVRYRADGNVEFLGRIDHQVKVRGFRIELGEVEGVLGRHAGLREAVVVAREDVAGDKRLVAYVAPVAESAPTVGELRGFLRQTLPEYMVPSAVVYLEALPLSPSGKVDRSALPAPEGVRPELAREYVAPRDETEEKLAATCAELLGVDRVGVYDNFFELGGHSLLATQFISRVRETFDVELPLRTLFERPTVADLAGQIEAAKETMQGDLAKIAEMLTRITEFSDEEAKVLLDEKRTLIGGRMGDD
jgi:amino acid adenylation domain-containing protein